ncbi:toll/interleukin-1 receptor domain-containing protein [Leptolyngbya sp. AN03gr2]|uniref:toll/interleukin-1 receptor domain-containing protein n=1 Tax=unclassified Leptolyngbya TaxID=2650499 RepID=UPI003D31EDCB
MVRKPVEIFFSYSHRDEPFQDELVKHLGVLKQHGIIQAWHDRQIVPGSQWADKIDKHLNSADVILLLISADFIASDYCYGIELKRAMQRHDRGEAYVIPVILRPVDWRSAPFSQLQALPKDGKAVTLWTNQDEAFTNVAQGIRTVVEAIRQREQESVRVPRERESVRIPCEQKAVRVPRVEPFPPAPSSIQHTALSIAMVLLGWLLAKLIGQQIDIPQSIMLAGGLGGLITGLSITMRLQLIRQTYSRYLLRSLLSWTVGNGMWGFLVGWIVESGGVSQSEGVWFVILPGIAAGVLYLIWKLRQIY